MKLSTKARYAITAMMNLALHEKDHPVTLADISQHQGISLSYLEQLFAKLRTQGLVRGVRGPGGGYRLSRTASEITIAEIVSAINEPEKVISDNEEITSESTAPVVSGEREALDQMWDQLSGRIYAFLNEISLAEFVQSGGADASDEVFSTGTHHHAAA